MVVRTKIRTQVHILRSREVFPGASTTAGEVFWMLFPLSARQLHSAASATCSGTPLADRTGPTC